jgi:hypothetical protein
MRLKLWMHNLAPVSRGIFLRHRRERGPAGRLKGMMAGVEWIIIHGEDLDYARWLRSAIYPSVAMQNENWPCDATGGIL